MSTQTLGRNLAGCCEDPQRNGEIEAATLLGQVGWSKIHGDAAVGKLEAAVEDGGAYAILAFLHSRFRQSDDRQRWKPVGQVHLNADQRSVESVLCAAE